MGEFNLERGVGAPFQQHLARLQGCGGGGVGVGQGGGGRGVEGTCYGGVFRGGVTGGC